MVIKSTTRHGVPFGVSTYPVTVKMAVNPKARLPILVGDRYVYIKDVVNTMVPWPMHLVFLSATTKVKIIVL